MNVCLSGTVFLSASLVSAAIIWHGLAIMKLQKYHIDLKRDFDTPMPEKESPFKANYFKAEE